MIRCLICGYEGEAHEAYGEGCVKHLLGRLCRAETALQGIKANTVCYRHGLLTGMKADDLFDQTVALAEFGLSVGNGDLSNAMKMESQ